MDPSKSEVARIIECALLAALLAGAAAVHAEASQAVVGLLQPIDDHGVVMGWAADPDTPAASIYVHFYLDGIAGAGQFVDFVLADAALSSPYPGNHGFRFVIRYAITMG